jgi:hypothetical protein
MDWLDMHHVILDFYNKIFTCLDEEGKQKTMEGIPSPISLRDISSLDMRRCFRKGCQLHATHVEELANCKIPSFEEFIVLQWYAYVFEEILGLPPKRDIYFSIDLMFGPTPMSKTPYTMSGP